MANRGFRRRTLKLALALICTSSCLQAARLYAQDSTLSITTDPSPKSSPDAKIPAFDVVLIKENKSGSNTMRSQTTPDGYRSSNLPLKNLIANAYGIKQDLISGAPNWIDSTGYDINAKVADEDVPLLKQLTGKQRFTMLKPVLAERFHLKVHLLTRTLPVYDLVVANSGSKLTISSAPAADPAAPRTPGSKVAGSMTMGDGTLTGIGLPVSGLANALEFAVHRTVIDKTGLTGRYDFVLKYSPQEDENASSRSDNSSSDSAPSIFTALEEQLGLKLQHSKGPVETLVIDHVDKPTED